MKILLLGGTRFAGRAVAARLLRAGHQVTVSSRRPEQAPAGAVTIGGERGDVLARLSGNRDYEVVIDFTAYDEAAAAQAIAALPTAAYLLISTTWLTRCIPEQRVDARVPVPCIVPDNLPEVTHRYLLGKAGAERSVVAAREAGRPAAVLRLPIMGGAGDHTGRLDFYRRRLCDGGPMLLVDGGENRSTLLWSRDAADGLSHALAAGRLFEHAILDGIPDEGHRVRDVLAMIAQAEGCPLRPRPVAAEVMGSLLPAYLEQEPLWREQASAPGSANLFELSGHRPHPLVEWLAKVIAAQPPRAETDGLRARERALVVTEVAA